MKVNYRNLMLSTYRQQTDIMKYFLDELEFDSNEYDLDSRTPLHYVIDDGLLAVVQLLLKDFNKRKIGILKHGMKITIQCRILHASYERISIKNKIFKQKIIVPK